MTFLPMIVWVGHDLRWYMECWDSWCERVTSHTLILLDDKTHSLKTLRNKKKWQYDIYGDIIYTYYVYIHGVHCHWTHYHCWDICYIWSYPSTILHICQAGSFISLTSKPQLISWVSEKPHPPKVGRSPNHLVCLVPMNFHSFLKGLKKEENPIGVGLVGVHPTIFW